MDSEKKFKKKKNKQQKIISDTWSLVTHNKETSNKLQLKLQKIKGQKIQLEVEREYQLQDIFTPHITHRHTTCHYEQS